MGAILSRSVPRVLACCACAALLACSETSGPEGWALQAAFVTELRVVGPDGAPLPSQLSPGDFVAIAVTSGGSSSCTRPGPVSLTTVFREVRVEVRDWVQTAPVACTRDLRPYPRQLLHTFFEPGQWTVRAVGRTDTAVRLTVAPGDAGEWALQAPLAVGLEVTLLSGAALPDSVPLGTPLSLAVWSAGSSTCTRPAPLAVSATSHGVSFELREWERVGPEPVVCTDDLRPLPRRLLHTPFVLGRHTIRVVGASGEVVRRVTVTAGDL